MKLTCAFLFCLVEIILIIGNSDARHKSTKQKVKYICEEECQSLKLPKTPNARRNCVNICLTIVRVVEKMEYDVINLDCKKSKKLSGLCNKECMKNPIQDLTENECTVNCIGLVLNGRRDAYLLDCIDPKFSKILKNQCKDDSCIKLESSDKG